MPRNYSIQDTIEMEKQRILNKNTTEIFSNATNSHLQKSDILSANDQSNKNETVHPSEEIADENKEIVSTGFFRKLFKWL